MRRYTFYLAVALLAFGLGSFVVFEFHVNITEQSLTDNQPQTGENIQDKKVENDLPSDEQYLQWQLDSFEPIITKWLEKKKIEKFVELKREDKWAGVTEREATVELIDVNGDNVEELAIQSGCSVVGNCGLWIFQKYMHGYNLIFSADMIQTFKLRKNKTKTYFDLETKSHGNSTSGGIAIYTFDGNEYKINKCFAYEYEPVTKKNGESLYTKDSQRVTKDKPTLTPASCENW